MLIDSRLKPELVAAKPPPTSKDGQPATHTPRELVHVVRHVHGVTPREVSDADGQVPGMAVTTDGRMAVAVPVTLCTLGDDMADLAGAVIPAALAHARRNLVGPKVASIELHSSETVTPDGAAFPRELPGSNARPATPESAPDPAGPCPHDATRDAIVGLFGGLGISEPTAAISLCPFRLLALAKAMGVREGDGLTLVFRGAEGPVSVLPLNPVACYQGEALGVLMPMKADPDEGREE